MPVSTNQPYDLAVVGAGVLGLSVAYRALQSGLRVVVVEAATVGAGASGGLLGALMPHMPARWNPKKQFQFDALRSIEAHVRKLESETGVSTGYRRCGRILPITSEDLLAHHKERAEEAKDHWAPETTGYRYDLEPQGARGDWLASSAAPFGLVHETLAARLAPRGYLEALATAIRARGALLEGTRVTGYDEASGQLQTTGDHAPILAGRVVLANGFHVFSLIEAMTGAMIGRGEKGQALLLEGKGLEEQPAIYCDGLYVVPHDNGTVAVGSTSERRVEDTDVDPEMTDALLARAKAFCPALENRQVLERWAGVRPRCDTRNPLIGRLPSRQRTFAAAGGFKITFGLAHRLAEALVCEILSEDTEVELPEIFTPQQHFAAGI